MCIYYQSKDQLTFAGQEHIFPASIGGIEKLPKGFVSDQANHYLSQLEQALLKTSIISLSREFFGPGKRGTDKLGEVSVSVLKSEDEYSLGYLFKGKPYSIPQLKINQVTGECFLIIDKKEGAEYIDKFIKYLQDFDGKFIYIKNKNISENEIYIGHYQKKYFVASASLNIELTKVQSLIKLFLEHSSSILEPEVRSAQVVVKNNMVLSKDNAKVYAKIAFNVLAKFKGKDYLQNSAFDEMRDWIVGERDININYFPTRNSNCNYMISEFTGHYCVLLNIDNHICAEVSLYGWKMGFRLGKIFDDSFNIPMGLFCDSENKKEFTLLEKFKEFANT